MENPHHEDDAQFWHVVAADEFDRQQYDAESTAPLRSVQVKALSSSGATDLCRVFLTLLSMNPRDVLQSAAPHQP